MYIASRKAKPLNEAAEALSAMGPGKCIPVVADLSTRAGCDALCNQIKQHETKVDVLVNNSGVSWGAPLVDFPEREGWDKVMALNVKSLFYMSVGLLDLLKKDADNVNPGRIINVSSVASISPIAEGGLSAVGNGTYSCTS